MHIILSEVLHQANEKAAPKVNSVKKVLKNIATEMKPPLFDSKIDFSMKHVGLIQYICHILVWVSLCKT